MATIDIDKFRAALMKDDLGRANLFKVEFPQKIGTFRKKSGNGNKFIGLFGSQFGSNAVRSISDAVTKEVLSRSEPLRHLTGFFSPEIIRAAGLGDILDKYTQYPYDLGIYVKDVGIPGRTLITTDSRSDQIPFATVTDAEYDLLTMTFLTTPSQKERQYFLEWMDLACNMNHYKFGFYDDYVASIRIKFCDRQGNMASITEVVGCYPVHVSDMQMSYDSNNQLAQFDVQFKFRKSATRTATDEGDGNLFTDAKHWYDSIKRISKIL